MAAESEQHAALQHGEFLEDRALVQDFAVKVIEAFADECISVSFLPWEDGVPPAGVLCPPSNAALLNATQLQEAIRGKSTVVCPCTFRFPAEESSATKIVEQLLALPDTCVLAAQLLSPVVEMTREWSSYVQDVLQRITDTHVDDVMLDPETEPSALRLRIRMAKHSWETNRAKLQAIMQQEPQAPTVEEIKRLEDAHQQILWTDIPRELMPHFGVLDPHLKETENEVGEYKLVSKKLCTCGAVWSATDKHGQLVAIKCIDKKTIFTPGEVEGINREYRFLQGFIEHPNIVRGLDILHSQTYVYLILEYAGDKNLVQHLSNLPGKRMEADASLGIFQKVVLAISYCHEKAITHRNVALEHVVLSKSETDDRLIPRLVDFHHAMVAKTGVMSRSVCGKLPCIAPEVLAAECYVPFFADAWSVGIVLLEMTGGLETLATAANLVPEEVDVFPMGEEQQKASAKKIRDYFSTAESHGNALACINGVRNEEILDLLQSLLVSPPNNRPVLKSLYPHLATAESTEAMANDGTDVNVSTTGS